MSTYWHQSPAQLLGTHLVDETDIGRVTSIGINFGRVVSFLFFRNNFEVRTASSLEVQSVDAILSSTLLVFISEMGDKTQLLSLLLVARFKKPWTILFGVLVATVANHALAAGAGDFIATHIDPITLKWSLFAIFIFFAIWILVPDKEGDLKEHSGANVFMTTVISFFLAEMGDKTQLATVALGARYYSTVAVTIGSTIGMLASNALAVFLGDKLLQRIPMKVVRIAASLLFLLFGIGILFVQ